MGAEAACTAWYQGRSAAGRALLETDELLFRGPFRLAIPLKIIDDVDAVDGVLVVRFRGDEARFELGRAAVRWADRIAHPPSLVEKLGIRSGDKVAVLGFTDGVFAKEVERVTGTRPLARAGKACDCVFLWVERAAALDRVPALRRGLSPDGALWIVRPKGVLANDVTEGGVLGAGRAADLVDVKVVRFSDTHTAHKFVIPRAGRPRPSK
jgi:hypothetical protein